jgi:SWIM zinc finger
VGIPFTTDQVMAMAPDSRSSARARELANTRHWQHLGQNVEGAGALWGECQGTTLYQVRVDLTTLTINCSCPSRKQPCKHGLALLLLAVEHPTSLDRGEPPQWVVEWLAKRAASRQPGQPHQHQPEEPESVTKVTRSSSPTAAKRAEKRLALVTAGMEQLDLWLRDLVRNGLGSVETQPAKFWMNQAATMVDAQAPGIASRIRRMAGIPNSSPDWPEKLLMQIGQLALLVEAFRRLETLDAALQEDVRQAIGWTLNQDEVAASGERVEDTWMILGQVVSDEEQRVRTQRTWLLGISTQRRALILQFSAGGVSFPEAFPVGTCQRAELVYWPGASLMRARIENRREVTPLRLHFGTESIEAFLANVAALLARSPWQERFLCALRAVTPLYDAANHRWYVRDSHGDALPLSSSIDHWQLLALSGGLPIDLAAEWNGEMLIPLGVLAENAYHIL